MCHISQKQMIMVILIILYKEQFAAESVVCELFSIFPPKLSCKNNFRTLTTDLKQKQGVDEWCNSNLGK